MILRVLWSESSGSLGVLQSANLSAPPACISLIPQIIMQKCRCIRLDSREVVSSVAWPERDPESLDTHFGSSFNIPYSQPFGPTFSIPKQQPRGPGLPGTSNPPWESEDLTVSPGRQVALTRSLPSRAQATPDLPAQRYSRHTTRY